MGVADASGVAAAAIVAKSTEKRKSASFQMSSPPQLLRLPSPLATSPPSSWPDKGEENEAQSEELSDFDACVGRGALLAPIDREGAGVLGTSSNLVN